MSYTFTRDYVINLDRRNNDKQMVLNLIYPLAESKQTKIIKHFLSNLYEFIYVNEFSVEAKVFALNFALNTFLNCIGNKVSIDKARQDTEQALRKASSISLTKFRPQLQQSRAKLLWRYLEESYFRLYSFYEIGFQNYEDYNIFSQKTIYESDSEPKLTEGKVVDVTKISILQSLVGQRKQIPKDPKKK